MPITPFIGVRISWLMLARKSDFIRVDSSAASRACVSRVSFCLSSALAWASSRSAEVRSAFSASRASFARLSRGVVHPDGELPLVADRGARADTGRALDRRRVDPAVDHAPRRVVLRPEVDPSHDPRRVDGLEREARGSQERGRSREGEVWVGHEIPPS